MKKILTAFLAMLMASTFAVSVFANVDSVGSKANNVTATFSAATKAPTLDGKVDKNEYYEVKYTTDELYYCGATDTQLNTAKNTKFRMYASYDSENIYFAVEIDTPNFVHTEGTKEAPVNMWKQFCLQLCCAKGDETNAENRTELAITRNSATNDQLYVLFVDKYANKWEAVGGKDFVCKTENGVTTYEIALPAKLFNMSKFSTGDSIRLCVTNILSPSADEATVVEWGNGCYTTKSSQQFPVITLVDAPKIATNSAPATADVASLAVAALAVSAAAAVVISKKH